MTGFHFTGTAVHALPELRFPFFRIPGSLGLEYSIKFTVINSCTAPNVYSKLINR